MNERIRELAEQATSIVEVKHEGYRGKGYTTQDEFFDREKFAESIVRECLGKIENEADQYAEPVWAFELINDIKEHFGVKE